MSQSITVKREIYNYVLNSISLQMKIDIVKNIREKFSLGLGQAKSMYDLVAWNEYHNYDSGQCISFLTDDVRNKISDYTTIIFEEPASTKPYEDSQVTTAQNALSKFVNEVRRERERGMLSHENLRRIYLNNFPSYFGNIQHDYYSPIEMMFGKYVLNWPTERVTYLISFKEWMFLKSWLEVLGIDEADRKKIQIIKQIRECVNGCGLAEAKGLFELAHYKYCGSAKYANNEITMLGSSVKAMIKDIDVVHTA